MSKNSETKWLSYYFGINFVLISVVTVFSRFFNIPPEYTGALVLVILVVSFFLIISFSAIPYQQEHQKQQKTDHNTADDRSIKNKEYFANKYKELREMNLQLQGQNKELSGLLEAANRDLDQIYTVFPHTAKPGKVQSALMATEGSAEQLYRLMYDKFKPLNSGIIGLEENIAYVYSLQLYKLVHNLNDTSPEIKKAMLSDKCRELNGKLTFVKMVNYNLDTTYNPDSHFCIDGNPRNNDIIKVHSFKIENTRTGEILRKAVVSNGDILL